MLTGKLNCKLSEHARLLPSGIFRQFPFVVTGSLTRRVLGLQDFGAGVRGKPKKFCNL